MRVLLIEDHLIDLKLMGAVLHMGGHSVEEQQTAKDAVQSLQARTPDVILLDMHLPDMVGLQLIGTIRAALQSRSVPIIAITCWPQPYRREDVIAAGCVNYLIKPIDTRTLAQIVREAAAATS